MSTVKSGTNVPEKSAIPPQSGVTFPTHPSGRQYPPVLPEIEQEAHYLKEQEAAGAQKARQELLALWIRHTNEAIDALFRWRRSLLVWQSRPDSLIAEKYFMTVIQNAAENGLLEWLDACPADLDGLRETLTGEEVKDA